MRDRARCRRAGRGVGDAVRRLAAGGRSTTSATRCLRAHERRLACCWPADAGLASRSRRSRGLTRQRRSCVQVDGADAWVTFTCRDGERTAHGERDRGRRRGRRTEVVAVARELHAPGRRRAARARGVTDAAVAYPNAGRAYDAASKSWSGGAGSRRPASAARRRLLRDRPGSCSPLTTSSPLTETRRFRARGGASASRPSSRRERLAVVQAVRAALPELDRVGARAGSRPSAAGAGRRPGTARRPPPGASSSHSRSGIASLCARRPGAELRAARAGGEVGVGLLGVEHLDRPLQPHLALQRLPQDRQRRARVRDQLARPCGSRSW